MYIGSRQSRVGSIVVMSELEEDNKKRSCEPWGKEEHEAEERKSSKKALQRT